MSSKQMSRIILMIEAILIVISLILGKLSLMGMICYWVIVALYHLSDYLFGRYEEDRDGQR